MSVIVACECGNTYDMRDEFRGKLVRCPKCSRTTRAGEIDVAAGTDPIFGHSVFLLRQKALALNEKYFVSDEQARPLLFVVRPLHFLRNLFAIVMGMIAGCVVAIIFIGLSSAIGGTAGSIFAILAMVAFIATFLVVAMSLSQKRHVSFHRGADATGARVMEVQQDKKVQFPTVTYTVLDADGKRLAGLRKNYLFNLFRKKWEVVGDNERVICTIREDSIVLSLLRRVLGPFFGLLRTNFVFERPDTETVLGEFKRKFTILDRYVLDLSQDRVQSLDRRVAVAAAVMLDTGERR